jgi:hypothetical protein
MVGDEAGFLRVERFGPVDIGHGHLHKLQAEVHGWHVSDRV